MLKDNHSQNAILVLRPDLRKIRVYYLVVVVPILSVVAVLRILPMQIIADLIVGYLIAGFVFLCAALSILFYRAQLRSTLYTVTQEYVAVEVDTGIFGRSSRYIPIANIQDVTVNSTMLQRFYDLASIVITATNGHSIVLADITDAETAQKTIWRLVRQAAAK